jgi:hypothetical protein
VALTKNLDLMKNQEIVKTQKRSQERARERARERTTNFHFHHSFIVSIENGSESGHKTLSR